MATIIRFRHERLRRDTQNSTTLWLSPDARIQTDHHSIDDSTQPLCKLRRIGNLLLCNGIRNVDRSSDDVHDRRLFLSTTLGAKQRLDPLDHTGQQSNTTQENLQKIHRLPSQFCSSS